MKRIYVGNLSYQTTEEGLRAAFGAFGRVNSVAIVQDHETGRSRGFAFVEMNDEEATAAISGLNGTELDGRTLAVNEARPRSGRPERGSERGGGGGGDYRRGGGRRW